jgi:ketosteroid isomerase-like protein
MTIHGLLTMKRRQLSILFITIAFFLALFLKVGAQSPADNTFAARQIAKTDSDYSALSVANGMPAACVAYFADDGIAFAPRAVNGKKYWASQKEFPGTLVWQPIFAASSRDGNLGYTTGPWELKKSNNTSAFGNYVTVWRKHSGEKWKIVLDVGVDNPQPAEAPPPLQLLPAELTASSREEAQRNYHRAARAFAAHAKEDIGKAIIEAAAPEIRVLRDKSFPAVGTSAAEVVLGSEHGKVTQQLSGTKLSSSTDLAYTYGNYFEERGNITEQGICLMIWQANLNGDWKVAVDLRKKIQPVKNE